MMSPWPEPCDPGWIPSTGSCLNSLWGEAVAASVVLAPGSGHDQDSIRNDLRARIAAYKIPKHIEFAATLPRTTSGKILRRALRERMARQVTAGALSLHADRPSHLRRP